MKVYCTTTNTTITTTTATTSTTNTTTTTTTSSSSSITNNKNNNNRSSNNRTTTTTNQIIFRKREKLRWGAERPIRRPTRRYWWEDSIKQYSREYDGCAVDVLDENRNVVVGLCGYGKKHWMSIEKGNLLIT